MLFSSKREIRVRGHIGNDIIYHRGYNGADDLFRFTYTRWTCTGRRSALQGTTMTDARITVTDADNDQTLAQFKPDENGDFKHEVPLDSGRLKTRLRIKTEDAAGNVNSAVVEVLNGDFKLPRRLKMVMPEGLVAGGEQAPVQTYVEYTDGTRELADSSKMTYSIVNGEANASLEQDGMLTGKRVGASLIQADYNWQGTELSTMDVVSVEAPKTERHHRITWIRLKRLRSVRAKRRDTCGDQRSRAQG